MFAIAPGERLILARSIQTFSDRLDECFDEPMLFHLKSQQKGLSGLSLNSFLCFERNGECKRMFFVSLEMSSRSPVTGEEWDYLLA